MKKIVSLLCAAAMLVGSLVFVGCPNGTSAGDGNARSAQTAGTGVVMGYVLDNRGEPVEGATVTLGGSVTTTNAGGEFVLSGVPVNVDTNKTATFQYSVTAKKDGYLSAVIPAIAVSYEESQSLETKDYFAALKELSGYYKGILEKYADKAGLTSTQTNVLNPNNDLDTGDFVITTTNEGSGKDNVMQTLANAIKDLEKLYSDGDYYTQFYSTFGKAVLIPCDATFKGKVRVTTKVKGSTVLPADLFVPASKPVVRVSYTTTSAAVETGKNDYTWKAEVDDKGFFSFEKLPSGVELSVSIDSFYETKDDVEYVWSSASCDIIAENSGAEGNAGAINKVKLGSADSNENTYSFILYAQNDKIWITASNLGTNTEANLIKTTDPITFTFNKPILKATIAAGANSTALKDDLTTHGYTSELSEDKKTVTFKPVDGNWTGSGAIVVKAEAEDGATTVLNEKWTVALDEKTWVSLSTKNYNDTEGLLSLSSPIVLEFTRKMTDNVTFTLDSTNEYTRTWNEGMTQLTLTPTAAAKYWKFGTGKTNVEISALKAKADDGTETVAFWKNGANTDGTKLNVYFDYFVDVTLAKAAAASNEAFTITFSKALKSFNPKNAAELVITEAKDGGAKLTLNKDYTVAIDEAKKVITVTSKEAQFPKEGKYKVTFLNTLEAEDGSNAFRIAGNKAKEASIAFTTDFAFEGLWLKPVAVSIVSSLPEAAKLSRSAIVDATTDQYIKISFNKNIYKSAITIKTGDTATAAGNATAEKAKNYIDGKDVYIALAEVSNVKKVLVLDGLDSVVAEDSDTLKKEQSTYTDWNKLTDGLEFRIYAALSLVDSSLVAKIPDVNGYKTYKAADPVADKTVTFTFDKELPANYTAEVDLYSWNTEKNKYTKSVDTEKLTWTEATKTITFKSEKFLPVLAKETATANKDSVYTTHYLSLVVKNENGVVLFSTKTASFGSDAGTFDNAFGGLIDKKDNSGKWASEQEFNTVKVNVAPYAITNYSLVKEVTDVAGKKSYKAAPAVKANTPLVFTFNALPEGATASYDLYAIDNSTNNPTSKLIEDAVTATIDATAKTVTISSNKLVVDADQAASATGYTEYAITLIVKDNAGNIVFSTDNATKKQFAVLKDSYEQKVFAPASGNEVKYTDDFGTTTTVKLYKDSKLSVNVLPVTITATSLVETKAKGVGQKKDTYKVFNPIVPGTSVDFTFSEDLTGTYVFAQLWGKKTKTGNEKDWLAYIDNGTGANKGITVAGNKVTIASDFLKSYNTAADTSYYLYLQINKGDKALFKTTSSYFGKVDNTFEKDALLTAINYVDPDYNGVTSNATKTLFGNHSISLDGKAINTLKVDVVKTNVVTIKEKKDSTTTTSTQFAESYNHNIDLEFTYNISGYTAVLYKSTTTPAPTTATKLADFLKNQAANIYTSAVVEPNTNKVTLKIGTNYFADNETVNVAIFEASDDKLCIIPNVTVVDKDKNTKAYTAKHDENASDDTWLKALTPTALPITDAEIAKVGNGQTVEFGPIDVKFNAKKTAQANYAVYVKDYSSTTVSSDDWRKLTSGYTVVYKDSNGEKLNAIAYQDYKLHSFNKVYISVTFAADAFGFGDKVSVAVLETLDSSRVLYTKTDLQDKFAPVVTINNVNKTTATNAAFQITKDGVAQTATLRIPDLKKVNELEIQGIGANAHAADNSATPPVVAGDAVNADFVLSLTGSEWLAEAEAKVETGHENSGATEGKRKTNAEIGKISWTAAGIGTIKFEKTLWFKGDVITITVKDASGNVATYKITIKD